MKSYRWNGMITFHKHNNDRDSFQVEKLFEMLRDFLTKYVFRLRIVLVQARPTIDKVFKVSETETYTHFVYYLEWGGNICNPDFDSTGRLRIKF